MFPATSTRRLVAAVGDLGGVAAIMASHPHMYGAQLEWVRAFEATVWVSQKHQHWVRREGGELSSWSEPFDVRAGIRAWQPGGHFPGSAVVLWRAGAEGRCVLLSGDTIAAVPAEGWVAFQRSYPNRIPLSAAVVARMSVPATTSDFHRLYDNFAGIVAADATPSVRQSAERYVSWVRGDHDADT